MKNKYSLFTFVALAFFSMASSGLDVLKGDKKLACEAKLCLMTGGGGRPSECQPSIDEFRRMLKKGPGKAKRWLNSCPDGDDGGHTDYVMMCTEERIFNYLYIRDPEDGYWVKGRAAADVPPACKNYVQKLNSDVAAQRANMPAGYEDQIPDVSLLPVKSMHWELVRCYNNEDCNRDYYRPVYVWSYKDKVPDGYTVAYDPNNGKRFAPPDCPSSGSGSFSPVCKTGVINSGQEETRNNWWHRN